MTRVGTALSAVLAILLAVTLHTTGCTNAEAPISNTVERYLTAVIQRDDEGMASVWGPFRREVASLTQEDYKKHLAAFSARVREGHKLYDEAKLQGSLGPDDLGITMFRALGMGKGAVSLPLSVRVEDGGAAARVRTRVVTNLETLHLNSLPDGVRIYLMGYPVGKLEMITVGFDEPEKHRLLESVDIEWRLSVATEITGSSGTWLIESIAADPNSSVEWKPKGKQG